MRKMSVCFSTRSSLRGSQRKEREKGGKMSLFALKKHSLSLSLSLFLFKSSFSFFLRCIIMFWLSIRFFFSSLFVHFFSHWVRSRVGLLSLFFPFKEGDRKPHHPFVSLSLSLTKRARVLENPISLSNTPFGTQKERGTIISEKKEEISTRLRYKLARESRKKKRMDYRFLQRVVASKTKTHMREQICASCVTFRPPPPRGMPPKFILPPLL